MSKLDPRRRLFRGFYQSLFDFHTEVDQILHCDLINWPFSEAPPAAF